MNFAHLHLVLTHFPPVLSVVGAISAAVGVIRRRRESVHLALLLLIAVGAMMPIVYIAGDRAADAIGRVDGVQQEAIAPHQEAATLALWISIGVALVAAALLIVERRSGGLSPRLRALTLVAAILAVLPIGRADALGGAIHHPEINSTAR